MNKGYPWSTGGVSFQPGVLEMVIEEMTPRLDLEG